MCFDGFIAAPSILLFACPSSGRMSRTFDTYRYGFVRFSVFRPSSSLSADTVRPARLLSELSLYHTSAVAESLWKVRVPENERLVKETLEAARDAIPCQM